MSSPQDPPPTQAQEAEASSELQDQPAPQAAVAAPSVGLAVANVIATAVPATAVAATAVPSPAVAATAVQATPVPATAVPVPAPATATVATADAAPEPTLVAKHDAVVIHQTAPPQQSPTAMAPATATAVQAQQHHVQPHQQPHQHSNVMMATATHEAAMAATAQAVQLEMVGSVRVEGGPGGEAAAAGVSNGAEVATATAAAAAKSIAGLVPDASHAHVPHAAAAPMPSETAVAVATALAAANASATAGDVPLHSVGASTPLSAMHAPGPALATPASAMSAMTMASLSPPPVKPIVVTNTHNLAARIPHISPGDAGLANAAAATAAIGITKHSWNDGSYRRVPNDYRLDTTVSPLEAWQRWHLGEVSKFPDPLTGKFNDIVIPPWKTLGSADLKGHSKYSTNTTNQDIKNVRLICRAFDSAAGLTAESTPSAIEIKDLYETPRVQKELPPNETPKGRKREVAQLSWLTCAKDKRRRLILDNPDKERHPGGRPRKSSIVNSTKASTGMSTADAAALATASFALSGGGASPPPVAEPHIDAPPMMEVDSPSMPRPNKRKSSQMSMSPPPSAQVPKSAALLEAEEEIAKQKAIQEKQKTVFELLKSRAELEKLGVSEDHINKYFPLPGSSGADPS